MKEVIHTIKVAFNADERGITPRRFTLQQSVCRDIAATKSMDSMMSIREAINPNGHFELQFGSLLASTGELTFPCDKAGRVDLDALSERGRNNYLYARAMRGRQYAAPRVVPCGRPVRDLAA